MLQITIPAREYYDSGKEEFVYVEERSIALEHSLLSIKKWESKWKKPFLGKEPKNFEETISYIQCMTITPNVPKAAYYGITKEIVEKINAYIEDPMTATWFSNRDKSKVNSSQVITAELIYYWMVSFQIPFECQKWHLNNLLTLIHICEIKNAPQKKMKKRDIFARNKALNASRRNRMGSNG